MIIEQLNFRYDEDFTSNGLNIKNCRYEVIALILAKKIDELIDVINELNNDYKSNL